MTLKSDMVSDARNIFLNASEFAEQVSYTPFGGSPKTIKAVVDRSRIDSNIQDSGRLVGKQAEIWIANHATDGVTSVNKGNDLVSMPNYNGGGTNVNWRVIEIIEKDEGMWRLLLQR
jgi:hypothetical protein